MKSSFIIILLCLCSTAQAEIYKHVDADGQVTYSSAPTKGAKKLNLGIPRKPPTTSARNNPTPANFPKVDSATQKSRDSARYKILEDELASEIKLLAETRQQLTDSTANPELYTGSDGKATPDSARHADKIKSLQRRIRLHEQNIEALRAELPKPK